MASVLRARWSPRKIDVWASAPVSHPQSYELAISRMKRGGVEFIYSRQYPAGFTCVISASATGMLLLMPAQPWSLYIKLFTLDPMWMLQKTSKGQYRAS